jgi:hypothetical protein
MKKVFQHSYGDAAYGLVYELEDGSFAVYEIPQYGGEEYLVESFAVGQLDAAIKLSMSFT